MSKITLDRYEQVRSKHEEECLELTYICSQVESDIELKKFNIYQPQFEINCQKRVDSQTLQVYSIGVYR